MDMIFEDDVAGTAPAIPTSPAAGFPTDGDLTTGRPATVIGAYWFYMITQELLALVVGAGLTPSGGVLTQVYAAVTTIATGLANAAQAAAIAAATTLANAAQTAAQNTVLGWFTGSNQGTGTNGYQKLPGGRIMQECDVFVAGAAHTSVTVTYPVAMTSSKAPLVSIVDPSESALAGNFLGLSVLSFSNTGCVVALDANGGGTRDVTLHVEVVGRP